MALPADVATRAVHGKWVNMAGAAMAGTVTFAPSAARLVDGAYQTVIAGTVVTATLDVNGEITATLVCTNDADLDGGPFTYLATVAFSGNAASTYTFSFELPTSPSSTLELATVTPVPAVTPEGNYVTTVNGHTGIVVLTAAEIGGQPDLGIISATIHGAVGDGTTDDTAAIQAALNAAPYGGVVLLPGSHATTAPLIIPPQVKLTGLRGELLDQQQKPTLIPKSSFSGSAVIKMLDQATGSYSVTSNDQQISALTIDGRNISSGTVHGIETVGYVHGIKLTDVTVRNLPGQAFKVTTSGGNWCYTVRAIRFNVNNLTAAYAVDAWISDCTWIECEIIGVSGTGWKIDGGANSTFIACRAEWCGTRGFEITGSWSGTGSGGPILIGCTTDRCSQDGVYVSSTSQAPIVITGGVFRRDGKSSTSAGYAGIRVVSNTGPVVITGVATYPGTDDDGGGNATPQYGLAVSGSALVTYGASSFHAIAEGVHDGGTNTLFARGAGVIERTGATGSPTTVTRGPQFNFITPPAVTGSRGGNAALASLLTTLAAQGLITNSSSA